MRIAVAGGTGRAGVHVVEVLRERGHEAVTLTRGTGVDLVTGSGLDRALARTDAVIDVSNVSTTRTAESVSFFAGATRSLLAAEQAAGVGHHVVLSIVNAEAAPEGYYAGKLAQERLVVEGPVPWTIQRTTQFHEFSALMYELARLGPVHIAPRGRVQPIAAREVAERLVDLAENGPAGRATDLAGPREESLPQMIRAYAHAIGRAGRIPAVPLPGQLGRAQRSGALLPAPGADLTRQTFAEWIEALSQR